MPKFVIEREIPNVGKMSCDELRHGAAQSNGALREIGPDIQWVQSYVTDNKIYCVYVAANEELIRAHAERSGFPADKIARVTAVIDPTTAEAEAGSVA